MKSDHVSGILLFHLVDTGKILKISQARLGFCLVPVEFGDKLTLEVESLSSTHPIHCRRPELEWIEEKYNHPVFGKSYAKN